MPKILVVLPYSGRGVGGGLAVLNAKLCEALSMNGEDVVLLHMSLPEKFAPLRADHGNTTLVAIKDDRSSNVEGPGASDAERRLLYSLLLAAVNKAQSPKELGLPPAQIWSPDIIVGHSRFSGPAAIGLKRLYPNARVAYFLHSAPVEGVLLTGTADLTDKPAEVIHLPEAVEKMTAEMAWMPQADIVVGVGPLLRQAAQGLAVMGAILGRTQVPVVHEFIPGVDLTEPVEQQEKKPDVLRLLLSGRGYASIKGVDDAVRAVHRLRKEGVKVELSVRGFAKDADVAQQWADYQFEQKTEDNPVKLLGTTKDIEAEYRRAHAVLMPSHFEHFGLVPFEAAAYGVPVLVTEVSGAAMFLADQSRVPAEIGLPCIVQDGGKAHIRPMVWADAIKALFDELPQRFRNAAKLRKVLSGYTWQHSAAALVRATLVPGLRIQLNSTVQESDGKIIAKAAL